MQIQISWTLAPLVTLLGALLALVPAFAAGTEIRPHADWCDAARALAPGEELVLDPGEYPGPCTITRGGTAEAPVVIRAKDPQTPPRIVYEGRDNNVLNIRAGHVTIRGLEFGPTQPDVDAIRIYQGDHVTIEDCRFSEIGGIAVVANHSSIRALTVRRNEIARSKATAMYFGCHDGVACAAADIVIEQNYVHGVAAPDPEIGYGVQVKLNSTATIRDNVFIDTKGPGIMVYGARDRTRVSVVERNLVAGSKTSSGIVLGGGPAIVRNNVTIRNAEAGIAAENYARRGLLRGLVVAHNTVYMNRQGGIMAPPEGRIEATLVNNAVHARVGTPAVPVGRIGVLSMGNLDCTLLRCFEDPEARDFSPVAISTGLALVEDRLPPDDYFGRKRPVPPSVGAIEPPGEAIPLGIKTRSP